MWALIIFFLAVTAVLMIFTYLKRRNKDEEIEINYEMDEECCGAHEVCDTDSLLTHNTKVMYYDDEELDSLSGKSPEEYTDNQRSTLSEVFYTLHESDVAGWLKSLQLRNIELPSELREEALMIISERRSVSHA